MAAPALEPGGCRQTHHDLNLYNHCKFSATDHTKNESSYVPPKVSTLVVTLGPGTGAEVKLNSLLHP